MPKALHQGSSPFKKEPSRTHRSPAIDVFTGQSCFADPVAFEKLLSETYWPSAGRRPKVSSPNSIQLTAVTSPSLSSSSCSTNSSSHSRSRTSNASKMCRTDKNDSSKSSKSGKTGSSADASRSGSGRGRRTAPSSQFRCDICGQYYSRRDNLRVHQRVHSGEMPYSCKYCGQEFRWLGALRSHESNHVRDGDVIGATPRPSSGRASGSRHSSSRHSQSSSRQTSSSRQPSAARQSSSSSNRHSSSRSQATELHRQNGSSASSRERRNGSSGSRSRLQVPALNLDHAMPQREDVIITDEDPGVSPMFHEPWHRVLDDEP